MIEDVRYEWQFLCGQWVRVSGWPERFYYVEDGKLMLEKYRG